MGVWLSGENGQDTNLSNFALMYFEKGQICKNVVCVGAENTLFPHMRAKKATLFICITFRFVGPHLHEHVFCFRCGHDGFVALFFVYSSFATSLGTKTLPILVGLFLVFSGLFWGCLVAFVCFFILRI